MKIAWLNEHLLYWNGGIRYIYEVTSRLAKDNQVLLYVTQASDENKGRFVKKNLSIIEFSDDMSANNSRYWTLYPYYLIRNKNRLNKKLLNSYDAVVSTSPTTDILAMLAGVKPIIVCFEVNPWLHNKEHVKGLPLLKRTLVRVAKPFIRPIEKTAYRNAKAIICHSKFVQSEIKRVYNVNSIIVSVGVDGKFFHRIENSNLHKVYKDYNILLHIASYLSPMKGTRYAIEAMKWIVKEVPNALLLITVATNERNRYTRKLVESVYDYGLSENIKFLPNVSDADMPVLYSLAKVILQPSLDENAHYSAIEGGCCECPTIGFVGKFDNEDIVEGTTGYIVDRYDSRAMAEAAIDVIKDKQLQGYLGRNARQFIINKFSWDKCIEKYKELI